MDGVLNESTNTVHRKAVSEHRLHTVCGVTHNLPEDNLQQVTIDQQIAATATSKCGRCFEEGGGY
jgi:uncharacterized metal-binding protein YceD (DUF177 family)